MENASRKKEYGFTFIDALLILIVIAAAIGLFFSLRGRRVVSDDKNTVDIVYQIEVAPLREEFRNLIAVGDTVVDPRSSLPLGEVTNVSYTAYSYTGTNRSTGSAVVTPVAGRSTMTVTIKASAVLSETGYFVNGNAVVLGGEMAFRVPDFEGEGTCVTVSRAAAPIAE